jgi:hypothetical protein
MEIFTKGHVPGWLVPPPVALEPVPPPLPAWLSAPVEQLKPTSEGRALMLVQFDAALPSILERVRGGATLNKAVEEYPVPLDLGVFTTWLYKDAGRKALYQEAKEVRAETWTGDMVKHALGEEVTADLDRSRFVVDTLKWLVSRHARREYGDTKTVEVNTTISIRAALEQARERVIDVQVIDDE